MLINSEKTNTKKINFFFLRNKILINIIILNRRTSMNSPVQRAKSTVWGKKCNPSRDPTKHKKGSFPPKRGYQVEKDVCVCVRACVRACVVVFSLISAHHENMPI